MSRHRYVRNLAEEDYYDYDDDDDDYYDEDDDDDQVNHKSTAATAAAAHDYRPSPPRTTAAANTSNKINSSSNQRNTVLAAPSVTAKLPATAKNESATAGVAKPPPGWERPTTAAVNNAASSKKTAVANTAASASSGGITKPPPGWGKPSSQPPSPSSLQAGSTTDASKQNTTTFKSPLSSTTAPTTTAGIAKPPPGWGRPANNTYSKTDKTPTSPSAKATTSTTTEPTHAKTPKATTFSIDFSSSNSNNNKSSTKPTTPATSNSGGPPPPKPLPPAVLSMLQSSASQQTQTQQQAQQQKSQLTMVVIGHVDAGKSTLVGQLLLQCGQVSSRLVQKYEQQATLIGKSSFGLAWILDETEQERSRGVTMDIATKSISLPQYDIILLDAPGHADFVPRMITGASSATVALLVIAATRNEFEAGWNRGQTKEHLILARGLGVTQLIVAINKLDVLDWNEARYQEIIHTVHPFLLQQGFTSPDRITYCPISGLSGINISSSNDNPSLLSSWYKGPTLLQAMNRLLPVPRNVLLEKPFRMVVTDVYSEGSNNKMGVQIRGRILQGVVQLNDACILLPIGDETVIGKMESFASTSTTTTTTTTSSTTNSNSNTITHHDFGMAGELMDVTLTGIDSSMRVSAGSVLSHAYIPLRPRISKRCRAKVWILPDLPPVVGPILRGVQVLFHMHHLDVPATISKLHSILSRNVSDNEEAATSTTTTASSSNNKSPQQQLLSSGHQQQQPQAQRPRFLAGGVTALVDITLNERICMENFVDCRPLGRFALRKSGETIGVGVIDCVL